MRERATWAADAKQVGARARGVRCWAAARGEGNLGRWLGTSGPNWLGGIGLRGRKGGGPSGLDRVLGLGPVGFGKLGLFSFILLFSNSISHSSSTI